MHNSLMRPLTLAFIVASALALLCPGSLEGGVASGQRRSNAVRSAAVVYECPMHPEVTSQKRGECPKCGMVLKPGSKKETSSETGKSAAQTTESATNPEAPNRTGGTTAPAQSASANYFPNHVLLNQDNKPVRFYDDMLKGKVVLINFIFTTCQGVCLPITANLAKVQGRLADHVAKDVSMISLSVDPEIDTPERLRAYADKFKVKPGWHFLTGKKENVNWVLYKLGGFVADKEKHSSVLLIGDETTGQWMKVHALANPIEIANAVTQLLAPKSEK